MKDTIYTIPLTDAFRSEDECPFCLIHKKLEEDALSFILGSAYMEDDIRMETDQIGFCQEHYKKMYDYGNRLGLALMLHTHYIALSKEFEAQIKAFTPSKGNFFTKFKKSKTSNPMEENTLSKWADSKTKSCYLCHSINTNFTRYLETFFYLVTSNEDFFTLFKASKGVCMTHFGNLMNIAEQKLSDKQKQTLYPILFEKMQTSLKRIEGDISWFIDKYDYRNKDADWKNSKDALPRGIQKLAGIYVQNAPFKEK